jgi:hypothetical protein
MLAFYTSLSMIWLYSRYSINVFRAKEYYSDLLLTILDSSVHGKKVLLVKGSL